MSDNAWTRLLTAEHAHGIAAVCRDRDGQLWLTADVEGGGGTGIEVGEASIEKLDSLVVVGGILPAGAFAVELRDRAGELHRGVCGNGTWIVVFESEVDVWDEPPVLFRDAAGDIVRRPLPAGALREPITDADTPCPACGAGRWELVSYELEREGEREPNRGAACVQCGHRELWESGESGSFEVASDSSHMNLEDRLADLEDELGRQLPDKIRAGLASEDPKEQAEAAKRLSSFMIAAHSEGLEAGLREGRFPVYGLGRQSTRQVSIAGWGSKGEDLSDVTIRYESDDPNRWVEIDTERLDDDEEDEDEGLWPSLIERVESRLEDALWSVDPIGSEDSTDVELSEPSETASTSEAAEWLRHAHEERELARTLASAAHVKWGIRVDGERIDFLVVQHGEFWAAAAQFGRLVIELAGHGLSPDEVELVRVDALGYVRAVFDDD